MMQNDAESDVNHNEPVRHLVKQTGSDYSKEQLCLMRYRVGIGGKFFRQKDHGLYAQKWNSVDNPWGSEPC